MSYDVLLISAISRVTKETSKKFQIIFSKISKNHISLCRFLLIWKALIHSILISDVKDMKSHVLRALGKISNKKALKFHLEFNFNNFHGRKDGKVLG